MRNDMWRSECVLWSFTRWCVNFNKREDLTQKVMNFRCLFHGTRKWLIIYRYYQSTKLPELTPNRYNIERGNYAIVHGQDVDVFKSIIGSEYVYHCDESDETNLEKYNIDFLRSVRGNSTLVLKPQTTQEISDILKYCNERKLAVCPQGGNTGLVGGSVPVFDEIILSMERFNKILSIDGLTGIVTCEAGCILENLDMKARENGLIVPLDLGAKSSCHIGGNLSTNAGGLRVLRYGNLHGSVLGLEVILANGSVMNLMTNFKKDNTGYHLKHLFIGSEGTLGVITKLAILCPAVSQSIHVAFLGLKSFDHVLRTYVKAKRYLGEILSSCELLDAKTLDASIEHFSLKSPIEGYPFYLLLETSGSNTQHDMEKFHRFLQLVMDAGDVDDGTITDEVHKVQNIWKLRELAPVALTRDGYCFKYDISIPLRSFYNIVPELEKRIGDNGDGETLVKRVTGYGHMGDSNLHLNVSCSAYSQKLHRCIEPFVYEYIAQLNGSISAEHGIGFLKRNYLHYSKCPDTIQMMRHVKQLFDPNNILNPYKVLN